MEGIKIYKIKTFVTIHPSRVDRCTLPFASNDKWDPRESFEFLAFLNGFSFGQIVLRIKESPQDNSLETGAQKFQYTKVSAITATGNVTDRTSIP